MKSSKADRRVAMGDLAAMVTVTTTATITLTKATIITAITITKQIVTTRLSLRRLVPGHLPQLRAPLHLPMTTLHNMPNIMAALTPMPRTGGTKHIFSIISRGMQPSKPNRLVVFLLRRVPRRHLLLLPHPKLRRRLLPHPQLLPHPRRQVVLQELVRTEL